nr:molybdopterin-dependent oxidoreductase [Microbacterium ulmi]
MAPPASPFAVIGGGLIDLAPAWAKDAAIGLFGTGDKIALLVGIAVVALVLAAVAGVLESRRPPWGRIVILALAGVGAVVATFRPDASLIAWLPAAVAGVVGAVALACLLRLLGADRRTPLIPQDDDDAAAPEPRAAVDPWSSAGPIDRRRFFAWTGATAGTGILAVIGANLLQTGSRTVTAVREALRLPRAATTAPPVPATAEFGISGLTKVITPNDRFYRIDTALIVPQVSTADWSLRIHGLVEDEVTITWDDLVALPLEESITTLACVSNPVGGDLIGNAKWLGYPIRLLLERARPTADADMVLSRSIDGFTASTPLEALTDDRNAILAIGMNDAPLPLEHGFPVRMVVPGLYGYVSATKWVTELEVTRFDRARGYWTERGWSERGPIKLESRIDLPRHAQGLSAGDTVIAGVAWQQQVGVSRVEVQIDDGPWQDAELATAISDDTWVQWRMPWTATEGDHTVRCRATSKDGERQTSDRVPPAPDGATGWHEIYVPVF